MRSLATRFGWLIGLNCRLSDDEEDETAELLRELEKIKRERAEQKEKEVGDTCASQYPELCN